MKIELDKNYGYIFRKKYIFRCCSVKENELKFIPNLLLENMYICIIETDKCYYVIKNRSNESIKDACSSLGMERHVPINCFINDVKTIESIINNNAGISETWNKAKGLFYIFAEYYNNAIYLQCREEELKEYFPEIYAFNEKISPLLETVSKVNTREIFAHFGYNGELNGDEDENEFLKIFYILYKESLKEVIKDLEL